jgi:hypothetical protein
MRPRVKPWTEEDIERLKKFAAESATVVRAAAALNRKMQSIQVQALKLGLYFPTLTEQKKKIGKVQTNPWRRGRPIIPREED